MNFNSLENKELLWNILLEHKLFNGISQKELPNIRNNFETLILNISNQPNKNVLELNKEFISNFKKYLNMLKNNQIKEVYIDDKNKMLNDTQIAFKLKQESYTENNIPKLPSALESIKEEEEPLNMDEAMAKIIKERNLELPGVTNNVDDTVYENKNNLNNLNNLDNLNNLNNLNNLDNLNFVDDDKQQLKYDNDANDLNSDEINHFKTLSLDDKLDNLYKELLILKKIILDNIN